MPCHTCQRPRPNTHMAAGAAAPCHCVSQPQHDSGAQPSPAAAAVTTCSHHFQCAPDDAWQHVAVAEWPVLLRQLNKVSQRVVCHHLQPQSHTKHNTQHASSRHDRQTRQAGRQQGWWFGVCAKQSREGGRSWGETHDALVTNCRHVCPAARRHARIPNKQKQTRCVTAVCLWQAVSDGCQPKMSSCVSRITNSSPHQAGVPSGCCLPVCPRPLHKQQRHCCLQLCL